MTKEGSHYVGKHIMRRLRKTGRFLKNVFSWLDDWEERREFKKITLTIIAVLIGSLLTSRFLLKLLPVYTWLIIPLAVGLIVQFFTMEGVSSYITRRIAIGCSLLAAVVFLLFNTEIISPQGTFGGLFVFSMLVIAVAGVLRELEINVLDALHYLFVVSICTLLAQCLAAMGKFEAVFRVILIYMAKLQSRWLKVSTAKIREIFNENPPSGEPNFDHQHLLAGDVVDRDQAGAKLMEIAASILRNVKKLEKLKQGPIRVVRGTGYDGFIGIASDADITRCEIGKLKRGYLSNLAEIAEKQADLGFFKEAKQTLGYIYTLAADISISDYAEEATVYGGSSWVSTWSRPERTAINSRRDAWAEADETADRLDLLEKMARVIRVKEGIPDNGNAARKYTRYCVQRGKAGKSIRTLEKLGINYEIIMDIIYETIRHTKFNRDSSRNRAVKDIIGYAFWKHHKYTFINRPDEKLLFQALAIILLGVRNKNDLEDWTVAALNKIYVKKHR